MGGEGCVWVRRKHGGEAARNEVLSDCDKTEAEGKKDCLERERER